MRGDRDDSMMTPWFYAATLCWQAIVERHACVLSHLCVFTVADIRRCRETTYWRLDANTPPFRYPPFNLSDFRPQKNHINWRSSKPTCSTSGLDQVLPPDLEADSLCQTFLSEHYLETLSPYRDYENKGYRSDGVPNHEEHQPQPYNNNQTSATPRTMMRTTSSTTTTPTETRTRETDPHLMCYQSKDEKANQKQTKE